MHKIRENMCVAAFMSHINNGLNIKLRAKKSAIECLVFVAVIHPHSK